MGDGTVDITVHIDETLDHARLQTIAEHVRTGFGVASAVFLLAEHYDGENPIRASVY